MFVPREESAFLNKLTSKHKNQKPKMITLLNQLLMSLQTEVKEVTFGAKGINQFDILYLYYSHQSIIFRFSFFGFFFLGSGLAFFCGLLFNV